MKLIKWAVLLALLFLAYKAVLPWLRHQDTSSAAKTNAAVSSCPAAAERASAAWGDQLGRFVNPPYDLEAWNNLRQDVDARIQNAEKECDCRSESCVKAGEAMRDLRSLLGDLDSAIRTGGPPPSDAPQRQESIDSQIERARELAREGK